MKVKTFEELASGDQIFLIDPSLPFKIRATGIKEIKVNHPKVGIVEVSYFKVTDTAQEIYKSIDDIPIERLLVMKGQTSTIAIVNGKPIPYFTNRRNLAKWMGKKKI